MLRIQDFTFNFFQEHSYVVWDDSGGCVIIDPGCESSEEKEELWDFIAGEGLKPAMVLLTHAHLDHIFGVKDTLERYGIKAMMDPSEAEIEFLVEIGEDVIPVEVKAEGNISGRSLSVYTQKYSPAKRIRFSMNNLQENGGLYSIPNPMADWMTRIISSQDEGKHN